jgi:hypothetical protein
MLAFRGEMGQEGGAVEERSFSVVGVTFFGKLEVARYPTREQAEWRARELNEQAERNPRGYIQYLVRPVREPEREG